MDLINLSTQLLPGMLSIAPYHRQAGQQPDNLCGPYWAAIVLQSWGFHRTPEQVAQQAGTALPIGKPSSWLPTGAPSRQDYSVTLPCTKTLADAGTSAHGLVRAVAIASNETYHLLPLQTQWSADRLTDLLHFCQEWQTVPLCNLRTGALWGSQLTISEAIAYLNGQSIQPPVADWDVGHWLALAGRITGTARSLIWVCDTYPLFGWQGYHLQPAERLAQALNRGDGYGGGVLIGVRDADRLAIEAAATQRGFRVELWDNGSPMP